MLFLKGKARNFTNKSPILTLKKLWKRFILKSFANFLRTFCLLFVEAYRQLFSVYFGGQCRFYPSCSSYAHQLISNKEVSLTKSLFLIGTRILKCHPFSKQRVDFAERY